MPYLTTPNSVEPFPLVSDSFTRVEMAAEKNKDFLCAWEIGERPRASQEPWASDIIFHNGDLC